MPELVAPSPAVPLREVVSRFWPDVRPHRGALVALLALASVPPAVETAAIWTFKRVVDEVLVAGDLSRLAPLAGLLVALTLADGLAGYADGVLGTRTAATFLLALRARVLRALLHLRPDALERRRVGDLLQRLSADTEAIETLLVSGLTGAVADALRVVLFAGALFWLDWRLAAVAAGAVPLFALAARHLSARMREVSREARRRGGGALAVAEESLSAAPLVQAYGREEAELERFLAEGRAGNRARIAAARLRAVFAPVLDLVELAGGLAVVALGAWELGQGRMTLGALLVFVTYLGRLYGPVRHLGSYAAAAYAAAAGAERLLEIVAAPADEPPRAPVRRAARPRGVIEVERVTFRYPAAARDALSDLSVRVAPGECVAVVGPSGSGKTTLAKLLLRFHDPCEGRIALDGRDLRELDLAELRDAVAVVLQETLVLHASVQENIAYGRPDADELAVRRAARRADADRFIRGFAEGYDTIVGQRGRRLSGGQRQRIALARAILRDAPVLILDEPTTGLDGRSARRVLRAMRRAMEARATILISHDLSVVRDATEILLLEEGRVVERGRHEALLARGGRYAALWRLRRDGERAPAEAAAHGAPP